jgi:hypothetical protein
MHAIALTGAGHQGVKTDKGIPSPFFTAFHGFEEKGVGIVPGNLGENRQWRIKIGDDGAVDRNEIGLPDHFRKGLQFGNVHESDL